MTAQDIIRQVQENASEWLEMSEDPSAFTAGILAHKITTLNSYIEYLEKRLHSHANTHENFSRSKTR